MIGNVGPLEIAIVLVIALLVFGPKRLPELGSGLGKGMREFKESITGDKDEDDKEDEVKALEASRESAPPSAEAEAEAAERKG
jgi:sec-independent protein translocase protein TatA